jgi:hypothetical protein
MAAKRPAGARYPHVTTQAKPHDHRWCPVAGAIARRAVDGKEQWGVRHDLPAVADETNSTGTGARDIKNGLYRARSCRQLLTEGLPAISIQADYDRLADGTFRPWIRVFSREQAKAEIVRRVKEGEPLHYNVMRSQP